MSDEALPSVVIFPWFVMIVYIFFIARHNVTINFVVDDQEIKHNCQTGPVAKDVEAGEHFLDTAINIAHCHFKARLAVLSDKVDVDDQQ